MEQKEAVMVLFDREEEYARLLSEFLRRQKELPWEIHTYTKMEELLEREKNGEVTMLVVAESSCMYTLSTLEPACQAILNESGTLRFHQFPNINKYQEADKVWKELLELYVETMGTQLPFLGAEYKTKVIGITDFCKVLLHLRWANCCQINIPLCILILNTILGL